MTLTGKKSMSWIRDVAHELKELDVSKKSLRKFGIVIGIILITVVIIFLWNSVSWRVLLLSLGGILLLNGIFIPNSLKDIYKIWMGFAFALGWVVSRIILTILFVFILTPIGLLAKIFGKEFIDLNFNKKNNSYWIPKKDSPVDYEKMY
jgi:predicted membrane protein